MSCIVCTGRAGEVVLDALKYRSGCAMNAAEYSLGGISAVSAGYGTYFESKRALLALC